MNCTQGDLAKVVAPAEMELRGRIVRCEQLLLTFSQGKVRPVWATDRKHYFRCRDCGGFHYSNRFLDEELRPLPGLPPDEEDFAGFYTDEILTTTTIGNS